MYILTYNRAKVHSPYLMGKKGDMIFKQKWQSWVPPKFNPNFVLFSLL